MIMRADLVVIAGELGILVKDCKGVFRAAGAWFFLGKRQEAAA